MSSYYGPGTDDLSFVPLTRDEEKELFTKFYAGDISARDELVRRHLKLVAKLSLSVAKRFIREDDAISAGNYGLMQALEGRKFDPSRGFRFASYVRSFVKGAVCQAMREKSPGFVKDELPYMPFDATVTGANAQTYHISDLSASGTTSGLHFALNRPGPKRQLELETAVDHEYEKTQLTSVRREAIESALGKLKRMEAIAIRAVELEGKSHADVAREHKVSRQASQQAWKRGMAKLKDLLTPMKSELC